MLSDTAVARLRALIENDVPRHLLAEFDQIVAGDDLDVARLGGVCEKGPHVEYEFDRDGCGSHIVADIHIVVERRRHSRDGHIQAQAIVSRIGRLHDLLGSYEWDQDAQ